MTSTRPQGQDDRDDLTVLPVHEGIEFTVDGQFLIDGVEVEPGRYRLQLGGEDGADPVTLTVADPDDPIA